MRSFFRCFSSTWCFSREKLYSFPILEVSLHLGSNESLRRAGGLKEFFFFFFFGAGWGCLRFFAQVFVWATEEVETGVRFGKEPLKINHILLVQLTSCPAMEVRAVWHPGHAWLRAYW